MKTFKNKIAIITGAAGGIGCGLAKRCVQEGMHVVLADIEEEALARTASALKQDGASVLAVVADVSKAQDVDTLVQKTLDAFGAIHLLFNNAGVAGGKTMWESTVADWEWVLGVNLWGVIHGIRAVVPIMLEQQTEGHIVNTASIAGFLSSPGHGIYKVSKHGVVSLSETLHHELAQRGAPIKVSVLCPGFVNTRILESERNRPASLLNESGTTSPTPDDAKRYAMWQEAIQLGKSPQQVATCVFQAIRDETFYIFTHPEGKSVIQLRTDDMLQERSPTDALAGTGL